jgi:hypothetical protein
MYEDIGRVIGNGFETWKKNLNLCIPFLLGAAFAIVALLPLAIALFGILGSFENIGDISSEDMIVIIQNNALLIGSLVLITVLLEALVDTFFTAGAVGMAKQATEEGFAALEVMWSVARKHVVNLFLARIIVALLILAGMILLLPGLMIPLQELGPSNMDELTSMDPDALGAALGGSAPHIIAPLLIGALIFLLYSFIVSIALSTMTYALVIDNLGPATAIRSALSFFRSNIFDVFMVWLIVLAVSLSVGMVGQLFANHPSAATMWSGLSTVISLVVIAPLSTVWWTRLYMSRTGKKLYEDDDKVKYLW